MYEEYRGILTHKKMISVGLRVAPVNVDQVTTGFKLQDATLLTTICNFVSKNIREKDLGNVFFPR